MGLNDLIENTHERIEELEIQLSAAQSLEEAEVIQKKINELYDILDDIRKDPEL